MNSNKSQREVAEINALNEYYAIISFKINGTVITANKKFLDLFGYELDEIKGIHHKVFCDKNLDELKYEKFWNDLNKGEAKAAEFKRVKKNGDSIFIRATYKPLKNEKGEVFEILKFAQDITEKKLEELNYSSQIQAINKSQAIIEFNMEGFVLNANKLFLEALGYELEEIVNKHHSIFCEEKYVNSQEYKEFWKKLNEGNFDTGKYQRLGKNGKKVWISATYTPILDIDGKPTKIIKFAQDITEFETIKKDHLTNDYNREMLIKDISENTQSNLAIIDIDSFSSVNDFYGYQVGDEIIIKFSKILNSMFDENFSIYRIYGDKFAILNHSFTKEKFEATVNSVVFELRELSIKLQIKEFDLVITCGISFESNEKILNTAEIVNKYAKRVMKSLLVYSSSLNIEKEFEENIKWAEKIKSALREDRIILHYQPIFNNFTKTNEKYEALVRLVDTDGQIVPPFKFLDIAKKSKQYIDITKRIIDKTFERFENEKYEFSINLTVEDIVDEELNQYLVNKITEHKIANRLVLEIVESEKITTYDPVYEFIEKVKALGCKVAIDDFGSGYSNFEYLVKINADYVKIDGSIIKRILEDDNSLEIVKSILTFCDKLGIKTIAEFISDEKLLEKVTQLGINYSQGFYVGKPDENLN